MPLSGVVFRATSPRYRDLHRTAEITRRAEARGRFNTAELKPGSRVQIDGAYALTREMLSELQRGTPVTVLIPELSGYALLP